MKNKNTKVRYKVKTNEKKAVYLLTLVPLLSSVIFLLSLNITANVPIVEKWGLYLIGNLEKFSLFAIVLTAGYVILWGFVGSMFSRCGVGLIKALLIGNAVYFLTAIVYTVMIFSGENAASLAELVGGIGMGIYSVLSGYMFFILPINFFEVYFSLLLALGVFAVGYSISGKSKKR